MYRLSGYTSHISTFEKMEREIMNKYEDEKLQEIRFSLIESEKYLKKNYGFEKIRSILNQIYKSLSDLRFEIAKQDRKKESEVSK